MDRIARVIVERSRVFLGLAAVLTILSVISLFFVSFNADVSSFLTEGNPVGEELVALQERYDSTDTINILVTLDEGATFEDREALSDLALIGSKLRSVSGVANVSSIVPARDSRHRADDHLNHDRERSRRDRRAAHRVKPRRRPAVER